MAADADKTVLDISAGDSVLAITDNRDGVIPIDDFIGEARRW